MAEKLTAAEAQRRNLQLFYDERNALIERGKNIVDARPRFDERRKQAELARNYRRPVRPERPQ